MRDAGRGGGLSLLLEDEFVSAGHHSDDPDGTRAMSLLYLDLEGAFGGHFRTPSLRNVAKTAPYMDAGQYGTLEEVVRHYSTLEDAVPPAEPEHVELLVRPFQLDERAIGRPRCVPRVADERVGWRGSFASKSLKAQSKRNTHAII